ncbi:conserved protein of unknown function [Xenorhabdus poinarii G6]|uniref:Uncharacterized protein n=1 Tax=Xenorhabdus poinarii G6 TaxID=1354304 RepID=A0A068R786_9GAMM|nr:conserved protein of unknown function [Xenorhabdus poinarii G6]
MNSKSRKDPRDLPAFSFLRAAQSLPLAAFIVPNQLPHPQLNLTELRPLTLVLLFEAVGLGTRGDQYQTARHNFYRERAANLKAGGFKPSSR